MKLLFLSMKLVPFGSPSPRRAWIEIQAVLLFCLKIHCRPPHGGRGLKYERGGEIKCLKLSPSPRRAWIEISVFMAGHLLNLSSPSPRRAWIEMPRSDCMLISTPSPSPRRAWIEIFMYLKHIYPNLLSPSPRRAWIEMTIQDSSHAGRSSPSPRRAWIEIMLLKTALRISQSRPPHGGRGLKFFLIGIAIFAVGVALPTEGVD